MEGACHCLLLTVIILLGQYSHCHEAVNCIKYRDGLGPRYDVQFEDVKNQPHEMSFGDVHVRILGKSGSVAITKYRCPANENQLTTAELVIRCKQTKVLTTKFEGLVERDASGLEVGRLRNPDIYNDFSSLNFTVETPKEVIVPYSNISAVSMSYSTELAHIGARVTIVVYILKEDGYIYSGSEKREAEMGTVKFDVVLENWKFCGCPGENEGQLLDLSITLTGGGNDAMAAGDGCCGSNLIRGHWSMGDKGCSMATLSEKVQVDGVWQDMAQGFPMKKEVDNMPVFVFRFPRFQHRLMYDPEIIASDLIELSAIKIG